MTVDLKEEGFTPLFLMRKLLIPLLASLALPTAVNAESYWLILGIVNSLEKLKWKIWSNAKNKGMNGSLKVCFGSMVKNLINV